MSTVIKVENLGKRYVLNHQAQDGGYIALRDVITDSVKSVFSKNSLLKNQEEFWALENLNFEIKQGDRVGIIGRNGAGKSTLLKILSRITEPTTGTVKLKGRVASLLEIGTGFHPELTGRENIFLNGAVLGMKRSEIKNKFDEIVAFAEMEKFLDTPVKKYSSGMYVRLAFSVAAHLEPDILILDEVIAVGDAQFQKKCLGKIEEVGAHGKTVLFVSHNMSAISSLCNKSILLNEGKIFSEGATLDVIKRYYKDKEFGGSRIKFSHKKIGNAECQLLEVASGSDSGYHEKFDLNESFFIETIFELHSADSGKYVVNYHVKGPSGEYIFVANQKDVQPRIRGRYSVKCKIPARLLNTGVYFIGVAVTKYTESGFDVCFYEKNALALNIVEQQDRTVDRYNNGSEVPGVIRPLLDWTEERIS